MAIRLSTLKTFPPSLRIIIIIGPSVIVLLLFLLLIFFPKNNEIKRLKTTIVKLDSEIADSEVKVRKLDALKVENRRLKESLAELKEQLPEEKEVSVLLKQISDLGLRSGLNILLWKPKKREPDPRGLYIKIPVEVTVVGGYHDLGVFFSHISRIKRIVNLSDIKIDSYKTKEGLKLIKANFTAITFSATSK
jgi:type IV pilus assembly protein PilO